MYLIAWCHDVPIRSSYNQSDRMIMGRLYSGLFNHVVPTRSIRIGKLFTKFGMQKKNNNTDFIMQTGIFMHINSACVI